MANWLLNGDDPNRTLQFGDPLKNLILRGKKVRDDVAKRMTIREAYTPASEYPNHVLFGFEPAEDGYQYPLYIIPGTQMVSKTIDPDTGAVRTTTREIVNSGSNATAIDGTGTFGEVESINNDWMIETIRQAAGIAGSAVNGIVTRTYQKHIIHYWPPVLANLWLRLVYADPLDAYSAVTGYILRKVWKAHSYNGHCEATFTERWTSAKPEFDGNASWPTGGGVPYLPKPTTLMPRPIDYNGVNFNIPVESCLHPAFVIWDAFEQTLEPATIQTTWPATIIAHCDCQPYLGGWMTTWATIKAPIPEGYTVSPGVASALALSAASLTTTSVRLTFASATSGTTLDVSTAPDFPSGGMVLNNVAISVAATTYDVTGLTRGLQYFARLKDDGVISETVQFMAAAEPEIRTQNGGTVIASGGTNATQSAAAGGSDADTLTIYNDGIKSLVITSIALSGTNADQWTKGTSPTTVAPGDSETQVVTFSPTSSGSKTAVLTITSNDPQSPHIINLAGSVLVPEINVKYLGSSVANNGSITPAGTTVIGGAASDYTLVIENTGGAALTVEADAMTGDFDIEISPNSPVAAGASTEVTVRYTPTGAPGLYSANLVLQSNDEDEDPYTITINVEAVP